MKSGKAKESSPGGEGGRPHNEGCIIPAQPTAQRPSQEDGKIIKVKNFT